MNINNFYDYLEDIHNVLFILLNTQHIVQCMCSLWLYSTQYEQCIGGCVFNISYYRLQAIASARLLLI